VTEIPSDLHAGTLQSQQNNWIIIDTAEGGNHPGTKPETLA